MLGIVKRWLTRRRLRHRGVFAYFDGEQTRYGDPLAIHRRLMGGGVDIKTIAPLAEAGQEPEASQLVDHVAAAFGVKRWDSQWATGLTDAEILDLMADLADFLDAKKKITSGPPTS